MSEGALLGGCTNYVYEDSGVLKFSCICRFY